MLGQEFVRIQARYHSKLGKPAGLFAANWHLLNAGRFSQEDKELFLAVEAWFREHLPLPPFYDLENPEKNNPQKAITYFKLDAIEKYEKKILVLAGLLEKYGIAYDVVLSNNIGGIIYEDAYQVAVI